MANTLSVYDPLFYAQEALIWLHKALGMAGRVYRGYEKTPQAPGSVISIRVPSTFSVQNAPSNAQDINASEAQISLNHWREVKFALTDKELSYTGERIITEHIQPAAYALADDIDQKLALLYREVPWYHDVASTAGISDITASRKILFDNQCPMDDLHMMLDSDMEADFLSQAAFTQYTGSGQTGVESQLRGSLGSRFGFEMFANQNAQLHTSGTASTGTLLVNNASGYPAGTSTINLDAVAVTGTLVPGDTLVFAGHSQRYAVTNTVTASANAFSNVGIFPALKTAVVDDEAVTVSLDSHSAALAFHRRAFALAMAPLSEMGNELGARISTVVDMVTGLSLRSRLYYVGNSSEVHVALDVLYGVKTLDPNLAVRMRN